MIYVKNIISQLSIIESMIEEIDFIEEFNYDIDDPKDYVTDIPIIARCAMIIEQYNRQNENSI